MNKILFTPWLYGITEEEQAKLKPLEPKDALAKLIMEGSFVTAQANIGNVLDVVNLSALKRRYLVWRDQIKNFTAVVGVPNKWISLFADGGSVTTGGLWEYGDAHSLKFKNLVSQIFEESRDVLKKLRELDVEVFGQEQKTEQKAVFDLASGTGWGDVTIRFFDGHEVDVVIKDKSYRKDFKTMGFLNMKTRKPNKQWEFLRNLAENSGEISWKSGSKVATDAGKKTKQILSEALKNCFGMKEDPFENYKKVNAYRIKLNLIPEFGSQKPIISSSEQTSNDPYEDLDDEFRKSSPQVYE